MLTRNTQLIKEAKYEKESRSSEDINNHKDAAQGMVSSLHLILFSF